MEKISKAHFKNILRFKQKKYIKDEKKIIVEGYRLLSQISSYGVEFEELYISEKNSYDIGDFKAQKKWLFSDMHFDRLSSTNHPQQIAALIKFEHKPLESYKKLIYLDNISDPGNLGTIIRSAVAFDLDGIVLSPDSVDILNAKVIRASMGGVFAIPIIYKDYNWLANTDTTVVTADISEKSKQIGQFLKSVNPIIVVIGSEANGISDEIKEIADFSVTIPISHKMESLNAAVSAAILIYEITNL